MSAVNLLDPNFYASIPLWIYITGGFGIIILINSSVLCCYCCKMEKQKKELELRELELQRKKYQFIIKQKQQIFQDEYSDIVITKPMKYSEIV